MSFLVEKREKSSWNAMAEPISTVNIKIAVKMNIMEFLLLIFDILVLLLRNEANIYKAFQTRLDYHSYTTFKLSNVKLSNVYEYDCLIKMIKNITSKKIIVKNSKSCKNMFCKAVGLMFTLPKKDYGLIFEFNSEKIIPLTMLFVFYRIDVLWLDKSKRVVEMRTLLPFIPNYTPEKKAKYVIELPVNTIKKTNTKINDRIKF